MKKIPKVILFSACAALAVILASVICFEVSTRRAIRDDFSGYEASCTEFSGYLLDISPSECGYYLNDTGGGYVLIRKDQDDSAETEIPSGMLENVKALEQAFYETTHRYGLEWVEISDGYVIYYEMSYGCCLIYSRGGKMDKAVKEQYVTQDHHRFIRLDEHWYAVRFK